MVTISLIALIAAAIFAVVWTMRRVRSSSVVAVLWGLYAVYEYLMYARVLCSGECNIRVDLLLIWPLLLIATIYAAVRALWRPRPPAA
jgi:hypothetical protein